ncbi:KdsC family phosphatase [Nibricoccus sp. IMCC34717]|uniref:KdsC family phosphatase n=1 Tax=Nibricoccus sp. IMCC34717 TaxID=3034021 RepID=UPI00384AF391
MAARKRTRPTKADWRRIRLVAMDVDGVLTDGGLQISSDGTETKTFNVLDGMGIARLLRSGIPVAWISGRPSGATRVRAEELKVPHVIQGRTDKREALEELCSQLGIAARDVVYVGDDDIDAGALRWAGVGVTVPGAMPAAKAAARWVTKRAAGAGAVREVCEQVFAAKGLRFVP